MTIKEALKHSGSYNILFVPFIKPTEKSINSNENVLYAITANVSFINNDEVIKIDPFKTKDKLSGIVVITSERVLFCNGAFGIGTNKSMFLNDIQSVDDKSNFLGSKLRIKGITETLIIDINNKAIKIFKEKLTSAMSNIKNQNTNAQVQNVSSADEILKYKNLLDVGAITQEEFDLKKKELLEL